MQPYKQRTIPILLSSTVAALLMMLLAAITSVQAQAVPQPDVKVEKGILDFDAGQPTGQPTGQAKVVNEIDALPGMPVIFHFRATNKSNFPVVLHLRDRLPEGMVSAEGEVVEMNMLLQANSMATRTLPVRIIATEVEDRLLVNRAGYVACPIVPVDPQRPIVACPWPIDELIKRTNPVTVTLAAPDLGDAPDSSNHFAKPMSTYGGAVTANFPTVFDPATGLPQGPRHRFAPFFHLGERVSAERGADVPPDSDFVTNLLPLLNQADNDRFDDGIRPGSLNFTNCQASTIPVAVAISPRAAAALSMTQATGYINIWVDANRDGDWADMQECIEPGQNSKQVPEHIVIDFPVNVAALGVGMHVVNVNTNLVPWPADAASKPSWVRVTLSDRPSNKTLGGGSYGDGSGYAEPFRTGETEDYLWRAPNDPANGADVAIHKKGEIAPHRQGNSDTISWVIEYANLGNSDATSVVIKDEAALAGDLTGLRIRTVPTLPYTIDGTMVTFNVGTLPVGARGHILVQTGIPTGTQQGTAFTNTVGITATNDVNPNNNRAQAVSDIGVKGAIIIAPGNGTTCDNSFEVTGLALPGSEVDLYVDNAKVGTVIAGGLGRWSMLVGPLGDGTHSLYAIARKGSFTSNPSRVVMVIVDSALAWSPLSLRFTDSHGLSRRPVDSEGRTDTDGWGIRLRRNETYTVSVKVCCDKPVSVNMIISDTINVPMTDGDGNKVFEGSFITPNERIKESFKLVVVCEDGETTGSGTVLIDPEGQVYDVKTGALLSEATVTCLEQQSVTSAQGTDTIFALWQADAYGQTNPQGTLADGHFSFFTPVGVYQLNVNRNGYQPYRSAEIAVVDEAVRYDVPLTPIIDKAANYVITVSENGFEPAYLEVPPGSVIEWVNVDSTGHSSTLAKQSVAADSEAVGEYVWDSGLLNSGDSYKFEMSSAGTYSYSDRSNSSNTGTIVVKEANATGTLQVFLPVVTK